MKYLFIIHLFVSSINSWLLTPEKQRIYEIINSGDGNTYNSPYVVYNIQEEYDVLKHLNLYPNIQYNIIINNTLYDVFIIGDKKIYFKIIHKHII